MPEQVASSARSVTEERLGVSEERRRAAHVLRN